MRLVLVLLLLASPVFAQDTISVSPKVIDYILDIAQDVYQEFPDDGCLVQQMCVSEEEEVDCFEVYIFNDGSMVMMPWTE